MRTLDSLSEDEAKRLLGVAFDLDDTVLTHGKLLPEALVAIHSLSASGLILVGVTGRSAAFAMTVASQWPLYGCIAENGCVAFKSSGRGVVLEDTSAVESRTQRTRALRALAEKVRSELPTLRESDDSMFRISDVAWDIAEREQVEEATVEKLLSLLQREGARTSRSSIHAHATFDGFDKASGLVWCLNRWLSLDESRALHSFAYVGDSPNDAPCFNAFMTTIGVANVARSVGRVSVPPKYVTRSEMGYGFAEFAATLANLRGR